MTNTRKTMSNKYWENETPIVTETQFGGVSYFKEAGKIQFYSMYEKNGELLRGKGCTWDNNEMEIDDVIRLTYALMQGLLDVGVESDEFLEAYNAIKNVVDVADIEAEEEISDDELDDALDAEFDDEIPDYNEMKLNELKGICDARGLEIPKRATKQVLVALLEADDDESSEDDSDADTESAEGYVGKNIKYVDGELHKTGKRVKNDYIEWGDDAIEWATYIAENAEEILNMPTKTAKQKKAQDKVYAELRSEVDDWVDAWEDEADSVEPIVKDLILSKMDASEAIIKFLAIVDGIKF